MKDYHLKKVMNILRLVRVTTHTNCDSNCSILNQINLIQGC